MPGTFATPKLETRKYSLARVAFCRAVKTTIYTVSHKKSQLVFIYNFVKNQRILMQLSLFDFKMNGTCKGMNFTHLT